MKKCTLTIKDFCNVKFDGLDPILRKRLVAELKYPDPNARFSHAFKLKRWDGNISFFSQGGGTYFNMLHLIIPMIMDEGYDIEVVDQRPEFDWVFPEIDENYWADKDKVWPSNHFLAGEPIMLREHQVRATNAFFENWSGVGRLATNFGKTLLCTTMSDVVQKVTGGRTIIIVPSTNLVLQTEADYKNCGLDVGVYFSKRKELGHAHTIVTWQSLDSLQKKPKLKKNDILDIEAFLADVTCIILDEAHMGSAPTIKELFSGHFAKIPLRWGITGTIPKEDFQFASILSGIGPIVIEVTNAELIEKEVSADCDIDIIQLKMSSITDSFESYDQEREYLKTSPCIMKWISDYSQLITENGSTMILVENLDTGYALQKLIPDSIFVHGDIDVDKRKIIYADIDKTKNKICIATYGVAAVGISITFLYNIILYNVGKAFVRCLQAIGRGLRRGTSNTNGQEKTKIRITDVTTDLKFSKRHLSIRKGYYKEEGLPFTITKVEI